MKDIKELFKASNIYSEYDSIVIRKPRKTIYLTSDTRLNNNNIYYNGNNEERKYILKNSNILVIFTSHGNYIFLIKLSYIKSLLRKRKIKIIRNEKHRGNI